MSSLFLLEPPVAFVILSCLQHELPYPQTYIAVCTPCFSAYWQTSLGLTEICEGYSFHWLHRIQTACTSSSPFPPTMVFFSVHGFLRKKGSEIPFKPLGFSYHIFPTHAQCAAAEVCFGSLAYDEPQHTSFEVERNLNK